MNVLFIHQNFPGQFRHLAPCLVREGHTVRALTMRLNSPDNWEGVSLITHTPTRSSTPAIHPLASDVETKLIRADSCFQTALRLRESGFNPDVVLAHPGWGESLFIKEVWPNCRLAVYSEFFYNNKGNDVGFDPEFLNNDPSNNCRISIKNFSSIYHFDLADAAISPTSWQASTYPSFFQKKISVIHDGIRTDIAKPDPNASLVLNGDLRISCEDQIITFVNRNLEPYRGYHIFMRMLPALLQRYPHARVLIVGDDGVSYGAKSTSGKSWKNIFFDEIKDKLSKQQLQRIHFLGHVPYHLLLAIFQVSSVHVYLTYPFVLSWSLLEAMSCGCAVVASSTQPLLEVINHNETGLLTDFFDIEMLLSNISALLDNSSLAQRLGRNARKYVCEHYDLYSICLPKQLEWFNSI